MSEGLSLLLEEGARPRGAYLDDGSLAVTYERGTTVRVHVATPEPVDVAVTGAGVSPDIAPIADGGFVVAWIDDGVYARAFDADAAPRTDSVRIDVGAAPLSADPEAASAAEGRRLLTLVSDTQGRLALAWVTADGMRGQRLTDALERLGLGPW